MAWGEGARQWARGLLSNIASAEDPLGQGEILVDDDGGVYGGDGETAIQDLKRMARVNEIIEAADVGVGEFDDGTPILDSTGRRLGGFHADGTLVPYKLAIPNETVTRDALVPEMTDELDAKVATQLIADTGPFAGGTVITDTTGRRLAGWHADGTFEALKIAGGGGGVSDGETVSLKTKKVTPGDSLTRGFDESGDWLLTEAWPYLLSQLDTDAEYTNLGTSGQTVDEESIRFGALVLQCTVAGASIPASGSVGITIPAGVGWRPSRTWTWQGSIAGVHGTLTRTTTATTALTFARTTSGSAVSVPTAVPFVCDDAVHEWDTAIIGIGRNDVQNNTLGLHATTREHVVAGTVRIVNYLAPQRKRFLLWGTSNATSETAGSTNHTTVVGINTDLAALYPNNFVDLRQYIVHELIYDMGLTPDSTDLSNMAADAPPPSIMVPGDGIHFAKAAHPFFANFFHTQLLRRYWI
jgi:hypothetical protein